MRDHHTHLQKGHATSGGRTRHVVNLVKPGTEGTAAITIVRGDTSADSAPSAITDGYVNFGLNKTLHVVLDNDDTSVTHTFVLWGYHSFSKKWAKLSVLNQAGGTDGVYTNLAALSCATGESQYVLLPIEGIERIYVQRTDTQNPAVSKTMTVYLGVNTI